MNTKQIEFSFMTFDLRIKTLMALLDKRSAGGTIYPMMRDEKAVGFLLSIMSLPKLRKIACMKPALPY